MDMWIKMDIPCGYSLHIKIISLKYTKEKSDVPCKQVAVVTLRCPCPTQLPPMSSDSPVYLMHGENKGCEYV